MLCHLTEAANSNPVTKGSQKDVEIVMRKYFTGARDRGADGRKRKLIAPVINGRDNLPE